jgi:hypothetical protein
MKCEENRGGREKASRMKAKLSVINRQFSVEEKSKMDFLSSMLCICGLEWGWMAAGRRRIAC